MAILAGGESRRFGTDKCLFEWRGKPLYRHIIDGLGGLFDLVVVAAGRNYDKYRGEGVVALQDDPGLMGPLAGIASVVSEFGGDVVFVPCDSPKIPARLIEAMLRETAAVAVLPSGDPIPVLAKYDSELARWAVEVLRGVGRDSPIDLARLMPEIAYIDVEGLGVDPSDVVGANTPGELGARKAFDRVLTGSVRISWNPPLLRILATCDADAAVREQRLYRSVGLVRLVQWVHRDYEACVRSVRDDRL